MQKNAMKTDLQPTRPVGVVADDRYCIQCGYNLRGLTQEGACPECGTLVQHSFQDESLEFASPAWLAHIERGLFILQLSLGAILAYPLAAIVVMFIEGVIRRSEDLYFANMMLNSAPAVVTIAAILGFIGILFASASDPSQATQESRFSDRRLMRTTALVLAAGVLSAILSQRLRWVGFIRSPMLSTAMGIAGTCLFGCLGLSFSHWLWRLHMRARTSAVGWAELSTLLVAAFSICATCYAVALGIVRFLGYNELLSSTVVGLAILVLVLGLCALGLLVLLIRTARRRIRMIRARGCGKFNT